MRERENPIPAFGGFKDHNFYDGMPLRDYFAAKALQGLISRHNTLSCQDIGFDTKTAYMFADAMMEEREK